jgi:hypothetical protein
MGFANPIALLFGALLGVLVLLYLWEKQRRRVDVPSLLLWQLLPDEPVQMQRFRPDWLFWLQALLLLLLVGGLARPYLEGGPAATAHRRHILVLDTSASMQTREARRTRFEDARDLALAELDRFGASDEVMIVSAAARPEVVVDFNADRAALRDALRRLEPVDTGTNIATAVALALHAREGDPERTDISLFTDMPASAIEAQDRPLVRRFAVGETSNNLAITSMQVFQGPFEDPRRARAFVQVDNFSYGEAHGFLNVGLNDDLVSRTGFTIPGRANRTFPVRGFPRAGLVTAQLDVGDALAVDNQARGWVREGRELKLLLVSEPSLLGEEIAAIARVVPEIHLDVVAPNRYDPARAAGYDVVAFHRFVPRLGVPLAPANAGRRAPGLLYVYPPVGNELFPVLAQAGDVEVMDWNDAHESLRGLRLLPSWPLHAALVLQLPPGAQPLLWSRDAAREFPLAFTDEAHGQRQAVLAFDLEAERLLSNDNVSMLVFFLNLLNWLAPAPGSLPTVLNTGALVTLEGMPAELPLEVDDPRGHTVKLPVGNNQFEVDLAGEYRVSADGTRRTVLANLFDAAESDVGRGKREIPIETAAPPPSEPVPVKRAFGWWLYAVAAALMLLEWIAWRRTA